MEKSKIAISFDKGLLDIVDSKVDDVLLRSRSQAIEFFVRQGLREQSVNAAILLVSKKHQGCLLKKMDKISLIKRQSMMFLENGISDIVIFTPPSKLENKLMIEARGCGVKIKIINAKSNGQALLSMKDYLKGSFIVMNGNIFIDFDIKSMIRSHFQSGKLATIGLMTEKNTSRFGNIKLEGGLVVDFIEKPKDSDTNIVNAGLYIFNDEVKQLFSEQKIETDLLPKLARLKQLSGYFIYGKYTNVK
jgi:NDP-sugar pyrophosphorylase family protein